MPSTKRLGGNWGSVLFDLHYGGGAGLVHYECAIWSDFYENGELPAELNTGVQC